MTHRSTRRQYRIPARAMVVLAAASLAAAGSQVAVADGQVNVVRSIDVAQHSGTTEIRVRGSKEPTFTVFKLAEPPRLVVDIAGSDISGVDRLLEVDRGDVKAVLTTQFSDANAKVGRVMVALDQDTTYDVKAVGDDVVITVDQPAGTQTVAEAKTPAPAAAATSTVAKADPTPTPTTTVAEADPKPAAPVAVAKVDPAPAKTDTPKPAAPARTHQANLPPGVVARHVDRYHGHHATGHRVLAVRAVDSRRGTIVAIRTDGPPARIETLELESPPRLAIDLDGLTRSPRHARIHHMGHDAAVAGIRIGRHAHKVRIVIDGRGERMPAYRIHRTSSGLAVDISHVAQAVAVSDGPHVTLATRAAKPAAEGQLGYVRALTYGRSGDVGRAILAIDQLGAVRYSVSHPDAHTAVLTLKGAELDPDLEQTFDASRYGGAVRALTAFTDPGHAGTVKIVANLAQPVKTRVRPSAGGLAWAFDLTKADSAQDIATADAPPTVVAAGLSTEGAMHVASSGERARYHGRRINLDFKEIDIHNVLRLIAEVSKRNLVVSDDVKGKVTLRLRNVPWDQALDLILKSNGLGKEVMGNIIRVAPEKVLEAEHEAAVKAAESRHKLEALHVRLIPVNFADAGAMATKIKDVLSDRGSVTVDKRTNSLIVKDIVEALSRAEQLVHRLDSETPQVLIESRIVEANTNYTREVGIQWGGNLSMSPVTGNPTGLVFPNIVTAAGAASAGTTPTSGTSSTPNFVVNMPAAIGTNSGGGIGMILGSVGGAVNLNLRLSALENEGTIKTISAPRISTLDNEKASISQGLSIPFSQVSAAGVNTTFIEAKLQLDVTPHVTADGSILMDITVTNNQPNPQLTGANGQPSISKKEAKTNVMVKDGQTTVIGGIYTRTSSEALNAVPGLSKIPILGWLFKKKNYQDARTELLVFITPRILNRMASTQAATTMQ